MYRKREVSSCLVSAKPFCFMFCKLQILRHLLRTVKSHEKDAEDDASVCSSLARKGEASAETQWKCLVPTIKIWRDELKQLKVLFTHICFP